MSIKYYIIVKLQQDFFNGLKGIPAIIFAVKYATPKWLKD